MRDAMPMVSNEAPSVINGDGDLNGFPLDRLSRQYTEIVMINDPDFGPGTGFDE
jgi:hypothetical protein